MSVCVYTWRRWMEQPQEDEGRGGGRRKEKEEEEEKMADLNMEGAHLERL